MITIELIVLKCSWHSLWVGRMKCHHMKKKSAVVFLLNISRFMNAPIVESARGKKRCHRNIVFVANISRRVARCTEDWLILNYTDIADRRCSVPWNDRRIWSCGRSFSQDRCYLVTRKYPIAKLSWNDFVALENVHPLHRNAVIKTRIKPAV